MSCRSPAFRRFVHVWSSAFRRFGEQSDEKTHNLAYKLPSRQAVKSLLVVPFMRYNHCVGSDYSRSQAEVVRKARLTHVGGESRFSHQTWLQNEPYSHFPLQSSAYLPG